MTVSISQIETLLREATRVYLETGSNRDEVAHYATLLVQATKESK